MKTIGDLRAYIDGMPDDMRLLVGEDGSDGAKDFWCAQEELVLRGEKDALHPDDVENGEYGEDPDIETVCVIWPVC